MLTIILLSRYDARYLERALSYYKMLGFSGTIIVADSSTQEEKVKVRNIVTETKNTLFDLELFEYDHSVIYQEKITDAVQKVTTPYVLFAGVDDFFSLTSLYTGMQFLQNNPNYSLVTGYCYGYTYKEGALNFYYNGDYDHPCHRDQKEPLARIDGYLSEFIETFHSVFRTEQVAPLMKHCLAYANDRCSKFFVNMFTMLILLEGKGFYLKAPFYWKEQQLSSLGERYRNSWLSNEQFSESIALMKEGLAKALASKINLSLDEAAKESDRIVERFVASMHTTLFPLEKKSGFKQFIKKFVPEGLWNNLKELRPIARVIRRKKWSGEHFLYDTQSSYSKEFELVKKLIKVSELPAWRGDLEEIRIKRAF